MTVYLDHNAATPVDPRVLECFVRVSETTPANPSSVHGPGRAARAALESARARAASALGVEADDVVFVSGGTEANATVLGGLGDISHPAWVSAGDHPSVIAPARARGVVVGGVDPKGFPRFEDPGIPVGLVCATYGQSDLGHLPDLDAAAALARVVEAPLHVDAAQALGRVSLEPVVAHAQSIAITVHKCGGLRGQGLLVCRGGWPLPLVRGGGHERGHRSGTPSPALAAATALAVELAQREVEARGAAMRAATRAFLAGLGGVEHRTVSREPSLPNTSLVMFPGVDGRLLLPALDVDGVAASQGSACSSGSSQPAPVLEAMGMAREQQQSCLRFSTDHTTSLDDARRAAAAVVDVVRRLSRTR